MKSISKRKQLDKKLKKVEAWKKVSSIIFAATFAAVLICLMAAAIAAPAVASVLAAIAAITIGSVGKWVDHLWR
ncbi:hypothetical protein SUGI_0438120 [Cryptomeria japonica]|nr:hypothetical protein SUGI_0438120 [Cryptomeria japonica]